ncbi:MAG: DUF3850 domain-containing protein [Stagnimonas sp.]|nr:DUF3850 domain-containing protein [Stagnimonas sp.]
MNNNEQMTREHELKTDPEVFEAVVSGAKKFEIRLDDRGFRVGDTLALRKTRHTGQQMRDGAALEFIGGPLYVYVTHILRGPIYGLADGWVCMSIEPRDGCAHAAQPAELDEAKERAAFEKRYPDSAWFWSKMLGEYGGTWCNVWQGWLTAKRHAASVGVQQSASASVSAQGQEAPANSLPFWSECALRVHNSDFINKRIAEGGHGAEPDSLLATELHRFIYEYDDADPYRSAWFMHRLELVLKEATQQPASAQAEPVAYRYKHDGQGHWRYSGEPSGCPKCGPAEPLYLAPPPATSREVPEEAIEMLANIADNLSDMPISEEWASKTADKIIHLLWNQVPHAPAAPKEG